MKTGRKSRKRVRTLAGDLRELADTVAGYVEARSTVAKARKAVLSLVERVQQGMVADEGRPKAKAGPAKSRALPSARAAAAKVRNAARKRGMRKPPSGSA